MSVITVVISTWQVPFDQVVQGIHHFVDPKAALDFINEQSANWWAEQEGNRSVAEGHTDSGYEPVAELGYNHARYELWGGEAGFHAMIDNESYARLHEERYKREYDDKGLTRPGYLINAYVADKKPGGVTEAEGEKYAREQAKGIAEIEATYSKPKH